MASMNNAIRKYNSKIRKDQLLPIFANAVERKTVLWQVTVFLSALLTKHLLTQLLVASNETHLDLISKLI